MSKYDKEPQMHTTLPQSRWFDISWDAIVVHFNEIALKGGNRRRFAEKLQYNLQRLLHNYSPKITLYHDRLLITADSSKISDILHQLSDVFGISYAAPVRVLEEDFNALRDSALETYQTVAEPGKTFAVRVKRANKQFPMKSTDIERNAGGYVKQETGAGVNLKQPDILLKFRVNNGSIYQEGPPIKGPDGLPVGISGKLLTLFSGGIDSPVAAWMALKRGCFSDFIHYHTFPNSEDVRETKIVRLIQQVIQPQGLQARLYLIPYHTFESGLFNSKVPREYELVIFRRFMVRVACAVAQQKKYAALVTGDNLGQVASQTMGNLVAFDAVANIPVFRPLVMMNKNEIVDLSQQIGTFEASIEPYKDCCSLVSSGPQTNPKQETIRRVESSMPIDEMIESAVDEMAAIDV